MAGLKEDMMILRGAAPERPAEPSNTPIQALNYYRSTTLVVVLVVAVTMPTLCLETRQAIDLSVSLSIFPSRSLSLSLSLSLLYLLLVFPV